MASRFLMGAAILMGSQAVWAGLVVSDDFESYTDEASLLAVWGEPPAGAGQLDTTLGNGGQSLYHPAGAATNTTSKRTFTATEPTETQAVIWQFDMLDDGQADKSFGGGLRDNGGGARLHAMLDMGRFIRAVDPKEDEGNQEDTFVSGYAVRTALIGGDPRVWLTFEGVPPVEAGWHRFTATILPSRIVFELDLQADGTIDGRRTIATTLGEGIAYNLVQFGGPENLFSLGGGGNFDNLRIASESAILGDMNGDGQVDFDDVAAFQLAISDPIAYRQQYGVGPFLRGDTDGDGDADFDDIPGFQELLDGDASARAVPEPAGLALAVSALVLLWFGRRL